MKREIKKPLSSKSKATRKVCGVCMKAINPEYGTATCPLCGVLQCAEFCITAGVGSPCENCEEADG